MTRLFPALLVLSLVSVLPQQSRADSEIYGGVGVGYSTFNIDNLQFEGANYLTRQFAGFQYGDYLGLEVGYTNFGTIDDQIGFQVGQPSLKGSIKSWGYNLSLLGSYPLNEELSAFGKFGVIRWDSETRLQTVSEKSTDNGDDLMYGIGLDYRGAGPFRVRIEFEFVDIAFADSWWAVSTSVIYGFKLSR